MFMTYSWYLFEYIPTIYKYPTHTCNGASIAFTASSVYIVIDAPTERVGTLIGSGTSSQPTDSGGSLFTTVC